MSHKIACFLLAAVVSVVTSCGGDSKTPPGDDSCRVECAPTCNTECGGASNVLAVRCVDGCSCDCR